MSDLIKPELFELDDPHGKPGDKLKFILSNFPAVQGREIIAKYPTSGLPKIGDYAVSEDVMVKLMSFVAVKRGDVEIRLDTRDLINNHCRDWETLAKVEMKMMEKNCSFFRDGRSLDFFENLAQICLTRVSEILTRSSAPLSPTNSQPSTNSGQSTI